MGSCNQATHEDGKGRRKGKRRCLRRGHSRGLQGMLPSHGHRQRWNHHKNDLRAAFDNVGRLVMDDELNQMLSEVGGPCNYDNMIKMFEAKMAGGVNDPDDLVVDSFKAYDEEVEEKVKGQMVTRHILEKENFIHILTAFGDKLTEDEIDDIFGEFEFDDNGDVMTKSVVDLFVAGAMDEKKEEEEEKKEEAAGDAPAADEGAKKKKKKKKAAK